MFKLDSVLRLPEETIKRFGGSGGVRDNNALDSTAAAWLRVHTSPAKP